MVKIIERVTGEEFTAWMKKSIFEPLGMTNTYDVLEKYVASYWNDRDNYIRKIYLKNDTLRYFHSEDMESALVPIGKKEFQLRMKN